MSTAKKTQENNFLKSEELITRLENKLVSKIEKLKTPPTLALIWVGDDQQTMKFVKAKKNKSSGLGILFSLHHFEKIEERQLNALIGSLNAKKDVDGIIIQLPLPKNIKEGKVLNKIVLEKDVDNLNGGDFPPPTPTGIIKLLQNNNIDLANKKTVIIGGGRLVGNPLAKIFKKNSWNFKQITSSAEAHTDEIVKADVLISATGVEGLVIPKMVNSNMVVVDGSGMDVKVEVIGPLVKLITPKKGAVGPLTVLSLLENVVNSAERRQGS